MSNAHPVPPEAPQPGTPDPPGEPAFLWLRRADQWFLGSVLCVLTVLLGVHLARLQGWGQRGEAIRVLSPEGYLYTLDINEATWVEWAQLDGIGETLARRIVQYRIEHGPFSGIDDVSEVKGIGNKTMERIRPHLRLRHAITADQAPNRVEQIP